MTPVQMKLFDVEDRAVAWVDPDTAFLFNGSDWVIATVHLARKAMLDGYELSWAEFAAQFPKAAAVRMPKWLLLRALDRPRGT